jgi:hypothetical protein
MLSEPTRRAVTDPVRARVALALIALAVVPSAARALGPEPAPPSDAAEPAPAAAPEASAAPAPARRIEVLIAADPREREALARVLVELMQRLSVAVEIAPVERLELRDVVAPMPADADYFARCFIDLRAASRARLYVHDPARDRVLERTLERTPGDGELAREELGHMLLASVEALLSGATLGSPRSEVAARAEPEAVSVPVASPAPYEPPAAAEEPARSSWWPPRCAVLYEASALGFGPGFTHGPVLLGMVTLPLEQSEIGLIASAQYRIPFEVDADPVGMRVNAFALRALATYARALSPRTSLRFALGGGADVTRITPKTDPHAAVEPSDARTATLAVARALAGLDLRLSPALALWVALAADVDLDRTRYVLVQSDGRDAELIAPFRVRPALSVGLVLP